MLTLIWYEGELPKEIEQFEKEDRIKICEDIILIKDNNELTTRCEELFEGMNNIDGNNYFIKTFKEFIEDEYENLELCMEISINKHFVITVDKRDFEEDILNYLCLDNEVEDILYEECNSCEEYNINTKIKYYIIKSIKSSIYNQLKQEDLF